MRIKTIEKVILTEEEFEIIEKSFRIIDEVYNACKEKGELERQTANIVESLNDFINSAEVELKKVR